MSWLSELFHPETSRASRDAVAAKAAADAKAASDATAAQTKQDQDRATAQAQLDALRSSATDAGRTSALKYFSDQGLDPTQYQGSIDDKINNILSTTAKDDPNVASYLSDIGQGIYGDQTNALQSKSLNAVNNEFQPGFERARISDTADDPYISQIDADQRGTADSYITNLLKRHVITDSGAAGAEKNLDNQNARVQTQLKGLGDSLLSGGRQKLTDIANQGRQTASTLRLGSTFDPSTFGQQADQTTNDFLGGLGDSLKSSVPGNLFDTSGLAAIAGTAQGAQNTNFDPRALAGLNINQDDPNNPTATNKNRGLF